MNVAEVEQITEAWLHWCGHLNLGFDAEDLVCRGCRFEVKAGRNPGEITRFMVVFWPRVIEPITDAKRQMLTFAMLGGTMKVPGPEGEMRAT